MKKNITTLLGFLMLLVPCTVVAQDNTQIVRRVLSDGRTVFEPVRSNSNVQTRGIADIFVARVKGQSYNGFSPDGKVNMTFWVENEGGGGFPYGDTYVDGTVFCGDGQNACIEDCGNDGGVYSVVIPDTISYEGKTYIVKAINSNAFYDCDIIEISMPSTITRIGYNAFEYTYLNDLYIPKSVTYMDGAISENYYLRTLIVEDGNPNYVTEDNVLFNKNKTEIITSAAYRDGETYVVPNTVTRIDYRAFWNNRNMKKLTIPSSVSYIGDGAFEYSSSLSDVEIPASVTYLGNGAFGGCPQLTNIKVNSGNKVYHSENGVVYTNTGDSIIQYPTGNIAKHYDIIDGTKLIYSSAFISADHLHSVTIPNTVTHIGWLAFFSCDSLEYVDIPSSVTYIASQAFDYCYNLTKVNLHSLEPPTTPTWSSAIFGGNKNLQIYVPYQSVAKYEANKLFTVAHIDPAIDRHDNHWTWVATFIHGVDFSNMQGAKAYKVVKNDGTTSGAKVNGAPIALAANGAVSPLKLVQVDKAGAGDCVLIKFDEDAPETIELTTDTTAANITDNLLKGVTDTTTVGSKEGTGTNYVFDGENFVQVTGTTDVATGLGYLQLPEDIQQSISGNTITIADLPATGINDIHADSGNGNQTIYNLQGQRVDNPTHGVYIVNGRKVVIK